MWKEKIKHEKEKKENSHRREKKKNRHVIFLLSIGDKWEILKLTFNAVNCFMKHNNFVLLVLLKFMAEKDVFGGNF